MEMTFNGYIMNPMGTKNAVFSQRDMYKKLYTEKLDKILLREGGKFTYTLYKDSTSNRYFCHIKVPSEVIEKFYYDVVIMFYTTNPSLKGEKTLKNYFVKFYSNDPSFVYTFAYAFNKNELIIEDLITKMSKRSIEQEASIRNPQSIIGYVKSLYFAYLIIQKYGLFEKINYTVKAKRYSKRALLNDIVPADTKVADRQEAEEKLQAKKKREKLKASNPINNFASNTVKKVIPISKTKTVSKNSKKVPTIKTVKKK